MMQGCDDWAREPKRSFLGTFKKHLSSSYLNSYDFIHYTTVEDKLIQNFAGFSKFVCLFIYMYNIHKFS